MRLTIPPGGALRAGVVDVSDLTDSTRTGAPRWLDETTLELPFDPEPTDAEQTLIRRRLLTRDAAHEARVAALLASAADLSTPASLASAVRLLLTEALEGIEDPPPVAAKSAKRSNK